jgi:hypothetical protein
MDETTQAVVEDNNQSIPMDEPTTSSNEAEATNDQLEQAADPEQEQSEPSESPVQEAEVEKPVVRLPRYEQRMRDMSAKLKEQAVNPTDYLPQNTQFVQAQPDDDGYIDPQQLHLASLQNADIIASAKVAQVVQDFEVRSKAQDYLNNYNADLQEISKSPYLTEELEKYLVEQLEARNPLEINGRLNPNIDQNVRLKDLAEPILKELEKQGTRAATTSQQELDKIADTAPIRATTQDSAPPSDDINALRERLADVTF